MHTIRLRSAWDEHDDGWSHRRFHKPTGLEIGERVWLVMDRTPAELTLNGEPLTGEARHEVTHLLKMANEVRLFAADDALRESVRLEIGPVGE